MLASHLGVLGRAMGLSVLFGFVAPYVLAYAVYLSAILTLDQSSRLRQTCEITAMLLGVVACLPFAILTGVWRGVQSNTALYRWELLISLGGWLLIGALVGGGVIGYRALWGGKR